MLRGARWDPSGFLWVCLGLNLTVPRFAWIDRVPLLLRIAKSSIPQLQYSVASDLKGHPMSQSQNDVSFSVSAGAFVGVLVGLGTQMAVHLTVYGTEGFGGKPLNPFRVLFQGFSVPLFIALLIFVVVFFASQLIRVRKDWEPDALPRVRWFSVGAIMAGVFGVLLVGIIATVRMTAGETEYFDFMFLAAGVYPFVLSIFVLPLGLLLAKGIAMLLAGRPQDAAN